MLLLSQSCPFPQGHASLKERNSLNQIVNCFSWLIGEPQFCPAFLYTRPLQRIATSILNDDSHPLYSDFKLLLSGRRFLVPRCRKKRQKNSFVPAAITSVSFRTFLAVGAGMSEQQMLYSCCRANPTLEMLFTCLLAYIFLSSHLFRSVKCFSLIAPVARMELRQPLIRVLRSGFLGPITDYWKQYRSIRSPGLFEAFYLSCHIFIIY